MANDKHIANTGNSITVKLGNNSNASTFSRASRACILCNDSTKSMHKYLCDDCRNLWMLLKDIAKEEGIQ